MTLRELAMQILQLPDDEQEQEIFYDTGDGIRWTDESTGKDLETPQIEPEEGLGRISAFTKVYDSDADGYVWVLHN